MGEGLEYLRNKRVLLMGVSVSQFIFGLFCVLLWLAAIELCQHCVDDSSDCDWTFLLQGMWGGALVLICGIVGMIQACTPSMSGNARHLIFSLMSIAASLGMVGLELWLLLSPNTGLDPFVFGSLVSRTFHWTVVGFGVICTFLGLITSIMAGYAQCGCCGTYCDTEVDYARYRRLEEPEEHMISQSLPVGTTDVPPSYLSTPRYTLSHHCRQAADAPPPRPSVGVTERVVYQPHASTPIGEEEDGTLSGHMSEQTPVEENPTISSSTPLEEHEIHNADMVEDDNYDDDDYLSLVDEAALRSEYPPSYTCVVSATESGC